MTVSDSLHELILTISPREHQYLRAWMGKEHPASKGKQLAMLDAIAAQKEYDEAAVRQHLDNLGFDTKFFAGDKRTLYLRILDLLCQRERPASHSALAKVAIDHARTLAGRGLYLQARKRVAQAVKVALAGEAFPLAVEAIDLALRICARLGHDPKPLRQQRLNILQAMTQLALLEEKSAAMLDLRRRFPRLRDQASAAEAAVILSDIPLNQPGSYSSRSAHITVNRIHAAWAFMCHNEDQELKLVLDSLQILNQEPPLYAEFYERTAELLNRVLSLCKYAPEPIFEQIFHRFMGFPSQSDIHDPYWTAYVFGQAFSIALSRYLSLGDFKRSREWADAIIREFDKHAEYLQPGTRMALLYGLAYLEYGAGRPAKALSFINRILNEFTIEHRPDLYQATLLFSMIVHLDLGNLSLLEYQVRNVRDQYRNRERLFMTEKYILSFFRKVVNAPESSYPILFTELGGKLQSALKNPMERNAHAHFDLFRWIHSRAGSLPFNQCKPGIVWSVYQIQLPDSWANLLYSSGIIRC